jgi:NAD-dependent dihydropyrimidine dehydrogenase PreA subunit
VIVGTTTLPEWGILPWTNTKRFGATRNPWDPDRTSGGSSAARRAAVAAGMVPLAHGNDGGGSTRIPAACCGLVGLKPQRGRISHAPELGESFLVTDGVLTRTVAETAALLDVLAGPELGDTSWAPPPAEPFARAAQREPEALRIAFTLRPPIATRSTRGTPTPYARPSRCSSPSATASRRPIPPWTEGGVLETFTALFAPLVMLQVTQARMIQGREPSSTELEPVSWALWQLVGNLSALDAQLAAVRAQGLARGFARWMAPFDAVLTPSLAEPRRCSTRSIGAPRTRWGSSRARGASRRSPRSRTSPVGRRSRCRSSSATVCRWACSSWVDRPRRARCSPSRPSSRRRGRGRPEGRPSRSACHHPEPPWRTSSQSPASARRTTRASRYVPVDCIHPTPDEPDYDKVEMLYIDPEECIDCDACVEACPVDACFAEDQLPDEWQHYSQINIEYYASR